jgi:hypothetical protein
MTNEQINAAIAEACGWTPDNRGLGWLSPHGYYAPEPDYCKDLNAMHEAEKVLTDDQREVFYPRNLGAWQSPFNVIYATARQRAEAFLRTLGKWEEVQP